MTELDIALRRMRWAWTAWFVLALLSGHVSDSSNRIAFLDAGEDPVRIAGAVAGGLVRLSVLIALVAAVRGVLRAAVRAGAGPVCTRLCLAAYLLLAVGCVTDVLLVLPRDTPVPPPFWLGLGPDVTRPVACALLFAALRTEPHGVFPAPPHGFAVGFTALVAMDVVWMVWSWTHAVERFGPAGAEGLILLDHPYRWCALLLGLRVATPVWFLGSLDARERSRPRSPRRDLRAGAANSIPAWRTAALGLALLLVGAAIPLAIEGIPVFQSRAPLTASLAGFVKWAFACFPTVATGLAVVVQAIAVAFLARQSAAFLLTRWVWLAGALVVLHAGVATLLLALRLGVTFPFGDAIAHFDNAASSLRLAARGAAAGLFALGLGVARTLGDQAGVADLDRPVRSQAGYLGLVLALPALFAGMGAKATLQGESPATTVPTVLGVTVGLWWILGGISLATEVGSGLGTACAAGEITDPPSEAARPASLGA